MSKFNIISYIIVIIIGVTAFGVKYYPAVSNQILISIFGASIVQFLWEISEKKP